MNKWRDAKDAPHNCTVILGDFGYPWAIPCAWNVYDGKWVTPMLQASTMENGENDTWFECERFEDKELKRWMHMPELPREKKK
jgi:hypothetical protein